MDVHPQSLPANDDLAARRVLWRRELLAKRAGMPAAVRAEADAAIAAALDAQLSRFEGVLGFYWPIQHEFDARTTVSAWLAASPGRRAVLPVVIKRATPLKFRQWDPGTPMQPAGFGTSVPASGEWLTPDALLVPLVGFDRQRYRLGYGGGYYDRTLAALPRRPDTTGIGYRLCALDSIEPQSYDLQLDRIIVA